MFIKYVTRVKNCNRMQNAADFFKGGGEFFINVGNAHVCYMNFDFVRVFHKV